MRLMGRRMKLGCLEEVGTEAGRNQERMRNLGEVTLLGVSGAWSLLAIVDSLLLLIDGEA